MINEQPPQHGTEGRGEDDADGIDTHGGSPTMGGKHLEDDQHGNGGHEPRSRPLNQAGHNECIAALCNTAGHAAKEKDHHRRQVGGANAEALHAPGR